MKLACRILIVLASAATSVACSREAAPAPASAETAVTPLISDAGNGDVGDGGPRAGAATDASLATPLSVAVAMVGGREIPITRDGSTFVDPAAGFRVEVAVHLADGRMALHDEQDAMVASSGTTEIGASWTRYRLVPEEPLRPGTSYALWIDGAVTREAHDPSGRAYGPVVLRLKTTGERPAAPARKKRGKPRS